MNDLDQVSCVDAREKRNGKQCRNDVSLLKQPDVDNTCDVGVVKHHWRTDPKGAKADADFGQISVADTH
eukprot:scaffold5899_cov167-Amphora_coffeaeformis.AAC.7